MGVVKVWYPARRGADSGQARAPARAKPELLPVSRYSHGASRTVGRYVCRLAARHPTISIRRGWPALRAGRVSGDTNEAACSSGPPQTLTHEGGRTPMPRSRAFPRSAQNHLSRPLSAVDAAGDGPTTQGVAAQIPRIPLPPSSPVVDPMRLLPGPVRGDEPGRGPHGRSLGRVAAASATLPRSADARTAKVAIGCLTRWSPVREAEIPTDQRARQWARRPRRGRWLLPSTQRMYP